MSNILEEFLEYFEKHIKTPKWNKCSASLQLCTVSWTRKTSLKYSILIRYSTLTVTKDHSL